MVSPSSPSYLIILRNIFADFLLTRIPRIQSYFNQEIPTIADSQLSGTLCILVNNHFLQIHDYNFPEKYLALFLADPADFPTVLFQL